LELFSLDASLNQGVALSLATRLEEPFLVDDSDRHHHSSRRAPGSRLQHPLHFTPCPPPRCPRHTTSRSLSRVAVTF